MAVFGVWMGVIHWPLTTKTLVRTARETDRETDTDRETERGGRGWGGIPLVPKPLDSIRHRVPEGRRPVMSFDSVFSPVFFHSDTVFSVTYHVPNTNTSSSQISSKAPTYLHLPQDFHSRCLGTYP